MLCVDPLASVSAIVLVAGSLELHWLQGGGGGGGGGVSGAITAVWI